jgi:hypothetical protein
MIWREPAAKLREHRRGFMTIEADVQKIMRDALPGVVKSMGKIATDANASATKRLEAMGVLLRVVRGPNHRAADSAEIAAGHDARVALSDAAPFLEQIVKSHKSKRVRSRAAKLTSHISKLEIPSR